MSTPEPPLVETVWIEAAPDRVFPFFTDAARITRWLGQAAELEPVPGGRFAVDVGDSLVRGAFVELDPPRRVVFTWGEAGSAALPSGSSRVEVDLEPADGGTTVTLRHHGLTGAVRAEHARGWPVVLGRLPAAAGR